MEQLIYVILALISGSVLLLVECKSTCDFPAIFNFGDSNSDTGGLSAAFGQAPLPHGETFFHHPAGRFSDGRLIIDFMAESLGLPFLSPYLDSMGSNFSHGANFATAGSTIRPQNTTMAQSGCSPISLNIQLVQFSDFHKRSHNFTAQGGVFATLMPKPDYFTKALYTFDIGQNDLTAGYKLNLTIDQVKANVPDMISQFSNVVKAVYENGGRSFWIHNTGPVGCYPYSLDRFVIKPEEFDKYGCAMPYNDVPQYFNQRLKEAIVQLRKDLPLATITYVDIYSLKYKLITRGNELGFKEPFITCCGHGGKYNYNTTARCGARKIVNGKEEIIANSCKDPSVKIIWDGVHFTDSANKWIFNHILNGSFSDPPTPLHLSCP
ncbi:GDSL-like Lipase/Acylhydrolase superfamily protein [Euphorbia peplus]|nr:GDSL-like Lipase/Acylhydrolase superfamily protein [Euphorbia peplus]